MRLFVAVRPPLDAVEDLARFLEPRREAGELRWTDPEQFHVTLAFLGACPPSALDPLIEGLAGAADRIGSREGRIAGGGVFPDPTHARVLYAGLTHPLDDLAVAVRSAANHAGAAPEGGRFQAHLTVARSGRPFEASKWLRILDTYDGPSWPVTEFELVESHLGQGRRHRPRHEVIATFGG